MTGPIPPGLPNVQVWALPHDGEDTYLADLGDYKLSRVAGEIGTVELTYPVTGAGFELLRPVVEDKAAQLEVEIRTDGTSANARRAILMAGKGDSIVPGAMWTITGLYLGVLMRAAVCPYEPGGQNGDTELAGTPGVIVRTLMLRAQARGALLDIDYSSFTNTTDSNGQPWEKQAVVRFSPGRDYSSILGEMEVDLDLCEWEVTSGRELRLYNPGTRGVDRTAPGPQVTLEYGRDLGDAPTSGSSETAGTVILASGKDGLYSEASNPTAEAELGRRIEVYRSYGSVADQGTLDALAQAEALIAANGVHEETHRLLLSEHSPVPGVDYDVSDWVLRAVPGDVAPRRVSQLVVERRSGELSASVTLGDLIAAQEVRTRRMIERLANGSGIAGTSTLPPDIDDGKAPAAPTGVTANSLAYYDGGTPLAQLTAAWLPVTTNDDGTAIGDLQGYEVWFRYQAGQGLPTEWQIGGLTGATSITWSPLVQGAAVDVRVLAYDKYGQDSAWSAIYSLTTATDADAPPVLSAPVVSPYIGILKVSWDGLGAAGEQMPGDFLEAEIHLSTTAGFTPNRPLLPDGRLDTAASTTYRDRLTGPGEYPLALGAYGTTYYVRLVAVDRSGNASAASAQGSAVLVQAGDGDIGAVSIGKLTAGIMSALMTISGIIRTAAAGARVELDTTGLRCIAADGRVLFEFNIPSSLLTVAGRILAGAGIGLGATIEIDPTGPRMRWYPNATTTHIEDRAWVSSAADGSGSTAVLEQQFRNAAGNSDGPYFQRWRDGIYLTFRNTADALFGGRLMLFPDAAWLSAGPGSPVGSHVKTQTDGRVEIVNANGSIVLESDGDLRFRGRFVSETGATAGLRIGNASISSAFKGIAIGYGASVSYSMNLQVTVVDGGGVNPGYVSAASATGFTANYEFARDVVVCWQAWGT